MDTITALRNDEVTQTTFKQINYKLGEIARNTIINDPKEVKGYIATAKNQITGEPLSEESRNKIAYAYDKYCQIQNIVWKKPFYKVEEKTPLIPSTENINTILYNATKRYTVIFQLLIELGAEGHELEKVKQKDNRRRTGNHKCTRLQRTQFQKPQTKTTSRRNAKSLPTQTHRRTTIPEKHTHGRSLQKHT